MNNPLCLENSIGNLVKGCPVFHKEKIQWTIGGTMLFQNAKKINLKVSVMPISDLWKRF